MLRTGIFAFIVAVLNLSAAAQTTRPTDKTPASAEQQAWPKTVEVFAKALVKSDMTALEGVVSTHLRVRAFESPQAVELGAMVQRIDKSMLVGQHGYMHPPLVMAADIAADFQNAAFISEKAKAKFLVDENDMKRANATAVQWMAEQLEARNGTPVAVIVLWTPRAGAAAAGETPVSEPLFILCKGEEVAAREFKITAVVYGYPAANP